MYQYPAQLSSGLVVEEDSGYQKSAAVLQSRKVSEVTKSSSKITGFLNLNV